MTEQVTYHGIKVPIDACTGEGLLGLPKDEMLARYADMDVAGSSLFGMDTAITDQTAQVVPTETVVTVEPPRVAHLGHGLLGELAVEG